MYQSLMTSKVATLADASGPARTRRLLSRYLVSDGLAQEEVLDLPPVQAVELLMEGPLVEMKLGSEESWPVTPRKACPRSKTTFEGWLQELTAPMTSDNSSPTI